MSQHRQWGEEARFKKLKRLTFFLSKMQIAIHDLRLGSKIIFSVQSPQLLRVTCVLLWNPFPHITVTYHTCNLNTLAPLQWQKPVVLILASLKLDTMFCTQSDINKHLLSEKMNEFQPFFQSFYIYCLESRVSIKQCAVLLSCFTCMNHILTIIL